MTWIYKQTDGELLHNDVFVGTGYSGAGVGRNNPAMQNVSGIGPIPEGDYTIGLSYRHPRLGPCTMNLDPVSGTQTFGRDAFRIHGDNVSHDASHGCIILGPSIRTLIDESGDRFLSVVS